MTGITIVGMAVGTNVGGMEGMMLTKITAGFGQSGRRTPNRGPRGRQRIALTELGVLAAIRRLPGLAGDMEGEGKRSQFRKRSYRSLTLVPSRHSRDSGNPA